MKKHPVDDLFKRKLEGLEKTPSEHAWLKIQEKQPGSRRSAKHRSVVWGWYAAAGVAAAVMGGYLVWQNQQASPGGIKPEQRIAATKPDQKDSVVSPVENSSVPVDQLASIEKGGNGLGNDPKDLKPAANASETARAKRAAKQMRKTTISDAEQIQEAPVVAITEKPSVPANTIQPEPMNAPVFQGIKTLPDEPAVSQANKPEPEPTRTIVVAVETGTNEADDKPRGSRFSRVFRQLKNVRAGEKVDWDEVGFNPKSLVARVDDRLRNKDERSTEKDHPKDKTKL
jgi:hypothetical protein